VQRHPGHLSHQVKLREARNSESGAPEFDTLGDIAWSRVIHADDGKHTSSCVFGDVVEPAAFDRDAIEPE
jgi:hypothetical protein